MGDVPCALCHVACSCVFGLNCYEHASSLSSALSCRLGVFVDSPPATCHVKTPPAFIRLTYAVRHVCYAPHLPPLLAPLSSEPSTCVCSCTCSAPCGATGPSSARPWRPMRRCRSWAPRAPTACMWCFSASWLCRWPRWTSRSRLSFR